MGAHVMSIQEEQSPEAWSQEYVRTSWINGVPQRIGLYGRQQGLKGRHFWWIGLELAWLTTVVGAGRLMAPLDGEKEPISIPSDPESEKFWISGGGVPGLTCIKALVIKTSRSWEFPRGVLMALLPHRASSKSDSRRGGTRWVSAISARVRSAADDVGADHGWFSLLQNHP